MLAPVHLVGQSKQDIKRVWMCLLQVTGLSNSEEEASGRAALVPFLLEDKLTQVCSSGYALIAGLFSKLTTVL